MNNELRIYFAAALRGGASFDELARRIAFLESIGDVLTKHMASPKTADMGHADDAAIYAHDQRLLEQSHIFIADLSSPSTGTGFMAARAVAAKKPALCLFREGQKPSAMIAGCAEITTRFFSDGDSFERCVREFLLANAHALASGITRAPKIFLAGPPGSGKGTVGKKLAESIGAAHVSTGELLRELVARNDGHPHAATIAADMKAGRLVSAEIMADIVIERLRMPDCRLFGFILDGYPPSRADLQNLTRAKVVPDLVFYLDCSDATSIARQVSRAGRSTDTPEKARKRLDVFHASELSFSALATSWFPNSMVVRVDAERSAEAVEAFVRECVRNMFGAVQREGSFFPLPPHRPEVVRSTRVHFHVDAPNVEILRAIARDIYVRNKSAQGQMKIYPIRSLHLGPQSTRLPIYRRLPNFHAFEDARDEAFITGRLGDGDDALMRTVLEVARAHGAMAELEEYTGEWTLAVDGTIAADSRYEILPARGDPFTDFASSLLPDIPAWELHLGFDLPKKNGPPPALETIAGECSARGMDNGGWFIFANEENWAFRSNEFSSADQESATAKLFSLAKDLQNILASMELACAVSFSLEKVHGIWTRES